MPIGKSAALLGTSFLLVSGGASMADICATPASPGLVALDVGHSTALAYVPDSVAGKPAPVVINLHPTGGKGDRQLKQARKVADENGFVMLVPTGAIGPVFSGWTWNVPGVPTFGGDQYPAEDDRDDVKFISDAIDKLAAEVCIDESRIYAMGFSGGGRMASQLACDLSDRIASVVAIGGIRFPREGDTELGLPQSRECRPSRAVPVQAIHGHWDAVNPWYDEALGETPFKRPGNSDEIIVANAPKQGTSWSYSGEEALERWVSFNGCAQTPKITALADGIEQRDYPGCRDDADVSLVFFKGVGHAVPGHETAWGPGQAESTIDGYQLAWDLLKDDVLPAK